MRLRTHLGFGIVGTGTAADGRAGRDAVSIVTAIYESAAIAAAAAPR